MLKKVALAFVVAALFCLYIHDSVAAGIELATTDLAAVPAISTMDKSQIRFDCDNFKEKAAVFRLIALNESQAASDYFKIVSQIYDSWHVYLLNWEGNSTNVP